MPVNTIKRTAQAAAAKIRRNWSYEERARRQAMAEAMQARLLSAIRLVPAMAPVQR